MANLPNDPISTIAPTADPNPDLPPPLSFPSLSRVVAGDLVGPDAANRQESSLERRDETLRTQVNKLIALCNTIDTTFLRKTNVAGKDGVVGPTASISWNNKKITSLADGTVASGGNDAVNGGQLYDHLPRGGGRPLTADLDFDGHNTNNLAAANSNGEAVEYAQFNTAISGLDADISGLDADITALSNATKDAARLNTGTLAAARMGSGTADSTKFLRGDRTWQSVTISTDELGSGTANSTKFLRGDRTWQPLQVTDWVVTACQFVHGGFQLVPQNVELNRLAWRRVGDSMEIVIHFYKNAGGPRSVSGVPTWKEYAIRLPVSGAQIDESVVFVPSAAYTPVSDAAGGPLGMGRISNEHPSYNDDDNSAVSSIHAGPPLGLPTYTGTMTVRNAWKEFNRVWCPDNGFRMDEMICLQARATVPIVGW